MKTLEIKLGYQKANEIDYNQFKELNKYENFITDCSKSQVIKRMTEEQYEEALEALEAGDDVNIVS